MTTTLSKTNPPQVGDRLPSGWVCRSSRTHYSDWSRNDEPGTIKSTWGELLYGLEVERAEEPIVIETDASLAWGIRIPNEHESWLYKQPHGTRLVLMFESEYKRLRGEG